MFSKDELNQLYRYALSLSADEQTAYDLVQIGIERYLKKISTKAVPMNKAIEKPQALLKTIIRNAYFDLVRHRNVLPMLSLDAEDESSLESSISLVNNDDMADLLINQQEVQQLMADLSVQENELLYLWAVEEYTVEEISQLYAQPKGTVLSKLHRLKKRIRAQWQARKDHLKHESYSRVGKE